MDKDNLFFLIANNCFVSCAPFVTKDHIKLLSQVQDRAGELGGKSLALEWKGSNTYRGSCSPVSIHHWGQHLRGYIWTHLRLRSAKRSVRELHWINSYRSDRLRRILYLTSSNVLWSVIRFRIISRYSLFNSVKVRWVRSKIKQCKLVVDHCYETFVDFVGFWFGFVGFSHLLGACMGNRCGIICI